MVHARRAHRPPRARGRGGRDGERAARGRRIGRAHDLVPRGDRAARPAAAARGGADALALGSLVRRRGARRADHRAPRRRRPSSRTRRRSTGATRRSTPGSRPDEEIAFCRDMIRIEIPDRADLDIVLPQIVFDDHLELDLGGVHVAIDHVGGDHAADSCVFHVVEDGLIVLGDCLYQRLYAPEPFLTIASVRSLASRDRRLRRAARDRGSRRHAMLDADALATPALRPHRRGRPGRTARRRRARDGPRRRRPRDARVPAHRPRVALHAARSRSAGPTRGRPCARTCRRSRRPSRGRARARGP